MDISNLSSPIILLCALLLVMKGVESADCQLKETQPAHDVLNSTEVEGDNQELSGYVQDNFEFLDQMDCSILDHMDCSVSCQVCVVVGGKYILTHFLWGKDK